MDQVYLDNVKLNNSNKKWVDIGIRDRRLNALEHNETFGKIQNIQWTRLSCLSSQEDERN